MTRKIDTDKFVVEMVNKIVKKNLGQQAEFSWETKENYPVIEYAFDSDMKKEELIEKCWAMEKLLRIYKFTEDDIEVNGEYNESIKRIFIVMNERAFYELEDIISIFKRVIQGRANPFTNKYK